MPWSGWGGLQEVPDAPGEVALEAADGFAGALAFGSFALEVGAGLGVAAGAGDGDAVNGSVDLAVAATVEPVAVGAAGAGRNRRDAGGTGELGVAGEPAGAGDLADELGGGQRPEAGLGQQLRRDLGDELRRLRELTQAINELETEIAELVAQVAPQLLAEPGFGPLTAAKLVGEIAGAARFSSDAKLARAAGPGTDPGQLRPHEPPSSRSRRQPPDQRCHPPCRGHPRALSPRNDRVPGAQEDRRQDAPRGRPLAQAPPRPPHLAAAPRAPPGLRNTAPPINFLTKEQQKQERT